MNNTKLPSKLVLTALLSSGLTIVICMSYIILCTIALIYRSDCDITDPPIGPNYLWKIVYLTYIQDGCENQTRLTDLNVTTTYTVFILLLVTLTSSIICLIMAGVLTAVVCNKAATQYTLNVTVYAYIGFCIASLVVDLTLATHFGMDYTYLSTKLTQSDQSDNQEGLFAMYYGAFVLMTISLKGFVAHAINLVLLVLLVIYAVENWSRRKEEHSIHKMGVLNAFEPYKKHDDNWSHHPNYPPFSRSSQINNGFTSDEDQPRSPAREPPRSDYISNRSFDRSDSWHHSRAAPDPGQGSRPFSYLEEIKRPVPVRPPVSPTPDPHWRRDQWPTVAGPTLPAPDYSPQTPRRLKSALKSGYM